MSSESSRLRRVRWPLVLLLAAIGAGRPERSSRPRHVLIVTLDTTRADHLAAYGSSRTFTPALDRLAREGVVFDEATTVAPLTFPAHCSLFTGLWPTRHGVRDNGSPPLASAHLTLAEELRRRGFRTAAFVASAVLDADRGLASGFDEYDDGTPLDGWSPQPVRRAGDEVVDAALGWLEHQHDSPFFMWVHLYDAHAPYEPRDPYRALYADDPYSGAIAYADTQIARVVAALERHRLLDRTLVVVAGDHGEALGDHGEQGHGMLVYQSVLRVPLIVRAPGIAPRRVAGVTRLIDVMPTVLDLVAEPASPKLETSGERRRDGVSLVPAIVGRTPSLDLEAYSETLYPLRIGHSPLRALRDGRFKMIQGDRSELYDLHTDPSESRNIAAERPAIVAAMAKRLDATSCGAALKGCERRAEALRHTRETEIAPDVRRRLAALGYIQ